MAAAAAHVIRPVAAAAIAAGKSSQFQKVVQVNFSMLYRGRIILKMFKYFFKSLWWQSVCGCAHLTRWKPQINVIQNNIIIILWIPVQVTFVTSPHFFFFSKRMHCAAPPLVCNTLFCFYSTCRRVDVARPHLSSYIFLAAGNAPHIQRHTHTQQTQITTKTPKPKRHK